MRACTLSAKGRYRVSSLIWLASSSALRGDYGAEPSTAAVVGGVTIYVALLIAGWVLTLVIAIWIIRAGVRGGIRELVEQNRQALTLLQNQSALLTELVRGAPPAKAAAPPPADLTDGASAWDQLRRP